MNLAWLAAVLKPHDVAPHANFGDDTYDNQPVPLLAAAVLGDAWRARDRFREADQGVANDDWEALVESSLHSDTVAVGVARLSARLLSEPPEDIAQAVALTLITCAAAAELDDYETCFAVLDSQLERVGHSTSPDVVLLRAALLQQKGLRLCDAGLDYVAVTLEAGGALVGLDVSACGAFATSPGVSWTSGRTVEQIRASLIEASAGLTPSVQHESAARAGVPSRLELVRRPATDFDFRLASMRAENYARHIVQEFRQRFDSRVRFLSYEPPDIFRTLLLAELMGDSRVYPLRKELAMLRLVRAETEPVSSADAIRLLRHAGAKDELDLALRRLRLSGPLSPLSQDARQVLRSRTKPSLLRTVELRVLAMSADILAPSEALAGLNAVRASLDAGGPPDLPMHWQLEILRKEAAWVAAASLGRVGSASMEAAELILEQALHSSLDDQMTDGSLRRAVSELEWPDVAPAAQRRWKRFVDGRGQGLKATREVVYSRLGEALPDADSDSPLDASINALNALLRGFSGADHDRLRAGVPDVREALSRIRRDAADNSWAMGGIDPADVAAGLLLNGLGEELWEDLGAFLLDPKVQRIDRAVALERLSRCGEALPEPFLSLFRDNPDQLLMEIGPDSPFGEAVIRPWPEALRFLASHHVLDRGDIFDAIAMLAGRADAGARREAAFTVGLLASGEADSDLLVIALTLAADHDAVVKANAGRALASLAQGQQPLARVARRRLSELLDEDGLLAPRLVLRGLTETSTPLDPGIRRQIASMAENHPSWAVRNEARKLAPSTRTAR